MEKPQVFYIIYFVDKDYNINGKHIEKGYYRYVYNLTGVDLPNPCMYSKDRYEWFTCGMFVSLGEFQDFFEKMVPKPMKMDREDYIETITYRGISVPIFCDDYGQCFYCIFGNKVVSFGSYNTEYEDELRHIIDYTLDEKPLFESNTSGTEESRP